MVHAARRGGSHWRKARTARPTVSDGRRRHAQGHGTGAQGIGERGAVRARQGGLNSSGGPTTMTDGAVLDRIDTLSGMIRIPGGTFRMGSDKHYPEEAPSHRVTVDGFWNDATPVTNAQF